MKSFTKDYLFEKKLIIYGGTMYGEIAYKMITTVYGGKVDTIIENRYSRLDWTNCKIIRSAELESLHDANVLVCAANSFENISRQIEQYANNNIEAFDICEVLRDYRTVYLQDADKITNSYLYGDLDIDEIVERYEYFAGKNTEYGQKIYLSYCVLCITSKCSLKCRDCAAFIPKYKEKKDYSLAYVRENFGKILTAVDGIMELELMGGEPFLCAEFDEILSWCIAQKKIRAIKIVTNGTILPKTETWELLKHPKVKLVIDDYGSASYQFQKIVNRAQNENVRYDKQDLQSWYRLEPIEKHGFEMLQLEGIYKNCSFRTCIGLTNGRFYHCNAAGHMNTVGILKDEDSDYIQIAGKDWNAMELREELKTFLAKPYIKACDFCNLYRNEEIPVAMQL